MVQSQFHNASNAERRGGCLLARLRFALRRGVTLVELMISMLILTIVCLSWLQIIGIQSARKEARRREAVERLSGMMDAFLYRYKDGSARSNYHYKMVRVGNNLDFERERNVNATQVVYPLFDNDVSSIGYRLNLVSGGQLPDKGFFSSNWRSYSWLVGQLYDRNGSVTDVGKPFFTLSVCMGL